MRGATCATAMDDETKFGLRIFLSAYRIPMAILYVFHFNFSNYVKNFNNQNGNEIQKLWRAREKK